jgi:competence protein ComEA
MKKYFPYILLILMLGVTYFLPKEETIIVEEKKEITTSIKSTFAVDVKGSVKNPGVYFLEEGKRVSDAIKASGGTTSGASLKYINLSMLLKDEMVIYVYSNKELINKEACPVIKPEICPVLSCPVIENPACKEEVDGKISINTATQAELETLPGIGTTKALDIIKYRTENNGFKDINELKNVSGIGEATFNNLKDLIKL